MSKRGFSVVLEDCLLRLDGGANLPDVLADHPEQADELKPLLLVAMASRAFPIPVPSQTAQRLGRNQMLAEMNCLEIKKAFRNKGSIPPASRLIGRLVSAARAYGITRTAYSYRLAMVALVLILSGGFFTVNASASSQPGDLLYTLRLGLERAGLTLMIPEQDSQAPPEPWKFAQTVWALEGLYNGTHDLGEDIPGSFSNNGQVLITGQDEIGEKNKEDAEAAREAAQELKEQEKEAAEAAREAAQELKEQELEAAEAAREAAQEQKEEEKEAAEAEREDAQEQKEEEQETAEDEKEAEQESAEDEQEAERDLKEEEKEAKMAEKEADKIEKQRIKDTRKNEK